ncbi:ABC transporter ATP-binding protein [Candidatus Hecatella orcuttiae]|uniref:ABC transporter ATP-binding protein n=1 Tax=Candidatus Hecatella orcuttiae TaxID=1935119 RepID=UPI002867B8FB|nr:ABC transporter ATP-binding protein [Candidatus Hecatella orcuttiae]
MKPGETVIAMRGITKRFPGVLANDHVDIDIKAGEIHAILGENGAGKTTLMNILYGLLQPDEGEIFVYGEKVTPKSPKDMIDLGIGMVHQHFMLIPTFTVVENIILGLESSKEPFLDVDLAEKKIIELSEKYGLKVNPKAKVWQLSTGERQRVEIIKALYRGAQVLIMDEPTSVLTPTEVEELSKILKRMAKEGLAIIPFITHKLPEVMAISDRVTVLRKGRVVGRFETKLTDEKSLAREMVGREVLFKLPKSEVKKGKVVLEVRGLWAQSDFGVSALKGVSFSIREGEILGVAGVAGNGQRELAEVIAGLRRAVAGRVLIDGRDVTNLPPREIIKQGLGHIPEDRMGMGLILDFSIAENIILETHSDPPFAYRWILPFKKRWFIDQDEVDKYAEKLLLEYNIVAAGKDTLARHLSGGNLQRLILARELSREPKVLVANQPTRGLDVGATEFIRRKLLEQRDRGVAILLISEDLDEVMSMSDRIAVLYEGEIMGILPAEKADMKEVGMMMAGSKRAQSLEEPA